MMNKKFQEFHFSLAVNWVRNKASPALIGRLRLLAATWLMLVLVFVYLLAGCSHAGCISQAKVTQPAIKPAGSFQGRISRYSQKIPFRSLHGWMAKVQWTQPFRTGRRTTPFKKLYKKVVQGSFQTILEPDVPFCPRYCFPCLLTPAYPFTPQQKN